MSHGTRITTSCLFRNNTVSDSHDIIFLQKNNYKKYQSNTKYPAKMPQVSMFLLVFGAEISIKRENN
jgi:hypothetical protein